MKLQEILHVVLAKVILASVLLKFYTMEYQVKVEYTGTQGDSQKWRSFMVLASKVNCGQYSFVSLVHDIKSRRPSLDFLNERTMCLHYVDDEESWININFDDLRGFTELWQCV